MSSQAPTTSPTTQVVEERNEIEPGIRGLVLFLTGLVVAFTLFSAYWFHRNRKLRIVQVHQPIFLLTICGGLFIWELSVIPLGIDDANSASASRVNMACMATEWLGLMGFTVAFAGLFSKLWRINKLFHTTRYTRVKVEAKDVLLPFGVLFSLNLCILVVWTVVDPLQWERQPIAYDPYNTFGACTSSGTVGYVCVGLASLLTFVAVLAVIRQAYKARNISTEFSESRYLAIGLLNWLQLIVIGEPVIALLGNSEPTAVYYLVAIFVLANCLSMLLVIFCPIYFHPSLRRNGDALIGANVVVTGGRTSRSPHISGIETVTGTVGTAATIPDRCDPTPDETVVVVSPENPAPMLELQEALIELKQKNADLEKRNEELEYLVMREDETGKEEQVGASVENGTADESG